MHSRVRIGRGPHQQDNGGKIETAGSIVLFTFYFLSYFLMNTGEFAEQREVVKDSLGMDKFPSLCIFL
jgi:hypothetical protein